jgi:hypothetical protein
VNPAAANLDGHALAARYEVLRHDMLAPADRRHTLHSLALLMRKGMAAWIKDIGEELPVREDITPPASSAMCVPEGIERSLVDIVAAMALATALEVCHELRYPVQSPGATP